VIFPTILREAPIFVSRFCAKRPIDLTFVREAPQLTVHCTYVTFLREAPTLFEARALFMDDPKGKSLTQRKNPVHKHGLVWMCNFNRKYLAQKSDESKIAPLFYFLYFSNYHC